MAKDEGAGGQSSAKMSRAMGAGMLWSSAVITGRRVVRGITLTSGSKAAALTPSSTVRLDFLVVCSVTGTAEVRVGLRIRLAGTVELCFDLDAWRVFCASARITAAGALELAWKGRIG